ncbi:UDP-N-acetylmuramate dehydrogenase [Sulfurospirillum arcachonense]|uniref:UDP-N-acetylmuramate dehydrogenase n=1 Tax=Sulfurospirillum arcachonense TaxID=57666 RepID=UPI00046AFE39|nr:UDP-N-acetylmuramate dehydrogenase [Sulfurospirillum arcachonense]
MKSIDLSSYTSIKIGPIVHVEVLKKALHVDKNTIILGGGNNLLVSSNPPKFAMLGKDFNFVHVKDNLLHIGGATPSGKILSYAKKYNIAHFELMQKLPGTLGGMIKMNAGLKEWEIFNYLKAIKTQNGWIEKKDLEYGYRYTNIDGTIYEASFEIHSGFDKSLLEFFKKLRDNQPNLPSAGSCFKNPANNFAGKLLDESDLKGFKVGNMAFCESHANFLVNLGNGTYDEAIKLIEIAKKRVFENSGIVLEMEIKIIDKI